MYLKTPVEALYPFNILAFMSQENETNTEVLSEELETEVEETTEDNIEEQIDWKARALKAEKAIIKSKKQPKAKETKEAVSPDILEKLEVIELKAEGIKDADEIKLVIEKSKLLGVTPTEALKDELVIGLLERNRKEKQDSLATPGSNSRGKTIERTPERIKQDFFKKGDVSKDEVRKMIQNHHKN